MSLQGNENNIVNYNYHIAGGIGGQGGTGGAKGGDGGTGGGPTVNLTHNNFRKEELHNWFQAIDMREKQRATHALRHNDTGRWVLEGIKFVKWKEQPRCLWIRGNCELFPFWCQDNVKRVKSCVVVT
ncbi:hypothetical protein DFH06DRAFT_1149023 [Mycena polygramma]|nr:hypothetical protein DFH06DRAFT_1149023 [Mycena polygramma]